MIIIALGLIGNMVQSNSISDALNQAFGLPALNVGIILAIVAAFIFVGGMKRIASFAELIVPIMALIYVIGSIGVLIIFRENIIPVLSAIFKGAFTSQSVLAGTAGYAVREAIRYGAARGLFSNEAGMGSTPNSHAVADVNHPVEQGFVAAIGVFIDTMIVCTATALVILTTNAHLTDNKGVGLTMNAFSEAFGHPGAQFLAIALTLFAFTTLVGWYYFGEGNVRYLTKNSNVALRFYQVFVFVAIIVGASLKVDFVWNLADLANALMVIPNVIGLFVLMSEVKELFKDYETQLREGKGLSYHYEYEKNVNI